MDLTDLAWNLFRKSLGSTAYARLKRSPLGRPYDYYAITTYRDIFGHYRSNISDFTSKKVLEVGSGAQLYTACYFLSAGASSVTLADPVLNDASLSALPSSIQKFQGFTGTSVSADVSKINTFPSLDLIPQSSDHRFDLICSHFALEHFDNLDSFFSNVARLLSPDGVSCNFVDLSDHAYHVFDGRKATKWIYRTRMLHHLKHSDRMYNFMTDKRIRVNRLLQPAYRALGTRHGLQATFTVISRCRPAAIHPDVMARNSTSDPGELTTTHFLMMLKRP